MLTFSRSEWPDVGASLRQERLDMLHVELAQWGGPWLNGGPTNARIDSTDRN